MKRGSSSEELTLQASVIAIAGSVAAVTLAECVFRVLYDMALRRAPAPGLYLMYGPPVLLALIAALPLAFAMRQPAGSFVLTLASLTAAVFVVTHFRGSHRWPGFYDVPDRSRWPFILGWIGALGLGALLTRMVPALRMQSLTLGLIGLAVAWTWMDAFRGIRLIMFIPYTRHIALATIVGIVLIAILVEKRFAAQGA